MGFWENLASLIFRLIAKKLEVEMIKKTIPILLTLFFGLIGLIFLSLGIINFLEIYMPNFLSKFVVAAIFFVLALVFKRGW
jgi:predicted permease